MLRRKNAGKNTGTDPVVTANPSHGTFKGGRCYWQVSQYRRESGGQTEKAKQTGLSWAEKERLFDMPIALSKGLFLGGTNLY